MLIHNWNIQIDRQMEYPQFLPIFEIRNTSNVKLHCVYYERSKSWITRKWNDVIEMFCSCAAGYVGSGLLGAEGCFEMSNNNSSTICNCQGDSSHCDENGHCLPLSDIINNHQRPISTDMWEMLFSFLRLLKENCSWNNLERKILRDVDKVLFT